MELNLPLFTFGGFSQSVTDRLPELNGPLKGTPFKLPRRSDRLTQLSLLGLTGTPGCEGLEADTHLVLASGDANLSSTIINSEQVFASRVIPNPIGFINTVNNSTAYHISQALGIHGQTVTVSRDYCSFEAGIQIAATLQHSSRSPILLGTVDEVPKDPDQHRRRLKLAGETPLAEGSFWFRCGHPQGSETPLARILYCGPMADIGEIAILFKERRVTHHLYGDPITDTPSTKEELPGLPVQPANQGHYLTQNAHYAQTWLANARPGERLGMVNKTTGSRRLSVTLIEKQ